MNEYKIDPIWHLAEAVSLQDAVALIAGYDPRLIAKCRNDMDFEDNFPKFYPVHTAVSNAVRSETLMAVVRYSDWTLHNDFLDGEDLEFLYPTRTYMMDDTTTSIATSDIRNWLKSRGYTSGFFFHKRDEAPDFLNPAHPCYSQKLAAAVNAWQAVISEQMYITNGKSVKTNLENWLFAHAAEYGLQKENGEFNDNAIKEQISKVANWDDKGGAPKTPKRKPLPS